MEKEERSGCARTARTGTLPEFITGLKWHLYDQGVRVYNPQLQSFSDRFCGHNKALRAVRMAFSYWLLGLPGRQNPAV